ncbi:MAG: DUF1616 domain-containing protein [Solirubrobacterales bacterium]
MRRLSAPWWGDLTAVVGLAIVAVAVALVPISGPARAIALLPLVLVLPGYALTCAMFLPGEIGRDLRLALSIAFSVGVAAVGGLVVQLVIPLDRPVWITLLALVTVVAAAVALRRRDGMPADTDRPTLRIPIVGAFSVLGILVAVAVGGWAIAVATEGAHRQAGEARFSSLWLVPAGAPQTPHSARIGVSNREGRSTAYGLTVKQGPRIVRRWRLTLAANQSWQATLPGSAIAGGGPVIAQLDRDGLREHRVTLRPGGDG